MSLKDQLTIGIEEEFQIIDSTTGELTSFVSQILEQGVILFRDQVQPELLQSQIEVGSNVCRNFTELRDEIIRLRGAVSEIAEKNGRRIIAAGTHPFSRWEDQKITPKDRYKGLIADMQYVARRLLVFGMHIHIGIPDKELRIDIMNQIRYFLPHLLTLGTSSPFWRGNNTGFKSYRSVIFEDFPRTGLPEAFESWAAYENFVKLLVKTNCIKDSTNIWWDIRPHPIFPTLEFRMCDSTPKVEEVLAIAAMLQALVAKLIELRENNQTWRIYRRALCAENKWRAIRGGLDAKLVDYGRQEENCARELIKEMVTFLDPTVDMLGSQKEFSYIYHMLENGSSANRQIEKFDETGDIKDVVNMLANETVEHC